MLKLFISLPLFAVLAGLTMVSAHAQDVTPVPPPVPLDTPQAYDEKEAQRIDGMLMCPVCPAETIDQAQVPIAKQMRQLVREKLAQGEGRDQILDYFAEVYGQDILAAPGKSGVNLVAWTVPVAGMLAALAAGFLVLRAMSARPNAETPAGSTGLQLPEDALAPYLEAIDQELAMPGSGPVTPAEETDPKTEREPEGQNG